MKADAPPIERRPLVFALRHIAQHFGGSCATSSVAALSVPLLIGWVLYGVVSYTLNPSRVHRSRPQGAV